MPTWFHATTAEPFQAFDPTVRGAFGSDAEHGIVWLAATDRLDFFGPNLAICEVAGDMETVTYTDFADDGDTMYLPEVMAAAIASTDAPVVRIRNVTLTEFGEPTTVLAVRDPARITITAWETV